MKKLQLNGFAMGALLLTGVIFTSCGKDNFENNNPEAAGLMAFNLAPDQSAVLFGISGNALTNSPLGFNVYTGGYLGIYPGNRSVDAFDYASGDSIASSNFNFEPKKYYSSFLVGKDGAYQNVVVHDNFDSLSSASGQAYIRYINAISGSASTTVKVTSGGTDVVNTTAPFASVSGFVQVAPGDVSITVSGENANANRTITAEQKKVYTVLLIPGATSADQAQIKFVTNGTLEDEAGQRVSSSAKSVNIK